MKAADLKSVRVQALVGSNPTLSARRPAPCRLFVILARSAPVGVILRRGPTEWVQLIKWDTAKDTFESGQWFHGRIYERRCDLSPDGSKLIYFASKHTARTMKNKDYTYAWTAISKPPWLTALALWPKGDTWHGGGLFRDNRTVLLNHHPHAAIPHKDHQPHRLEVIPNPFARGEDLPIYGKRLGLDGWILKQKGLDPFSAEPAIWEKPDPTRKRILVMKLVGINFRQPGGLYVFEFEVLNRRRKVELHLGRMSWADWDHRGRLAYATEGKLFAGKFHVKGVIRPKELADFNAAKPSRVESPASARTW